jgi:MoxR-like ATPase
MQELYSRVSHHLVGRRHEALIILAAIASGRHVLLEGPPGTSKSTILKAVVKELGRPIFTVTGNSDLTASKLLGYFDPARVLSEGYKPEHFQAGPLTRAMREGAILYVEEFNRLPDDTANVFVNATSEREISLPRVGTVTATPEFCVVGALNPHDDTGTLRLSRALRDRFCSVRLDYQSRAEEIDIVTRRAAAEHESDRGRWTGLVQTAVELCRRTRDHTDVRLGASVRGAIDMVVVARRLLGTLDGETGGDARRRLVLAAALTALRDKVWLNETTNRSADEILDEIWNGLAEEWQSAEGDFWEWGDPSEIKKKRSAPQPS